MSNTTASEILASLDTSLKGAWGDVIRLGQISIEDQEFLALYDNLKDRQAFVEEMAAKIKNLMNTVASERYFRWRTEERFYVYMSFRFGKPIEASLHSLGEASGSSWHDLHYAALHWQRMEKMNERTGRKGGEIHYSIMAYSPHTGQIRKLDQVEIDAALSTTPKAG